ncbi:MAG: hypothetical protein ACRCY4_10105 [Brevinema sp.]
MMIYRLFRYFIIVFSLIFLILFFVRNIFSPIPELNNLFNSIEGYYISLGKQAPQQRTPEVFFARLEETGTRLLAPLNASMEQFLNDPEFPLALEMLKSGDFDDWEYLIRARLIADNNFRDLTVNYENKMIYRYENAVINAPLIFTNNFKTIRGDFVVAFHYNADPVLSTLNDQLIPLAVKIRSDVYYSPSLNRVFPTFLAQVSEKTLIAPVGIGVENATQTLYYYKLQQNLQVPILLFTLETLPAPPHSYAKTFFFIVIFMILLGIWFLDRLICYFFTIWQRKTVKNREFSQYRPPKSSSKAEPNLDWLEDLAKSDQEASSENKDD